MSGKGSGRRPAQVNEQAFSDSWDSIFGKGEKLPDVPIENCKVSSFSGAIVGNGQPMPSGPIQIYADNPIYND